MTDKKKVSDDPILNALAFEPKKDVPVPVKKAEIATIPEADAQMNRDFEYSRENMMHLIENGRDALDDLIQVAKQSSHPRAFEVIATMIKTIADTNKDLLSLHKQRKELKSETVVHNNSTVNNLFLSTKDLQNMVLKMKEPKVIENEAPNEDV